MSRLTGDDMMKDLEFLVKELHKEWERSGAAKATVIIEVEEAGEVNQTLAKKIIKKQQALEKDEISFRESILLSKENFILLRMAKKIKAREDKTSEKGMNREFAISLDREEFKLFRTMFEPKLR